MAKQPKPITRAYKLGHNAAVKMCANRNPYAENSTRWHDFNRGYEDRIREAKAAGLSHPEAYADA